jgi:flagellar hook-associated protein 3 FlgL
MRISTQMLFENGAARLGELQAGLVRTQSQIASGRRMLVPSDDPVAAARALEFSQSQSINTQHGVNRQHAKNALGLLEGTLAGVTALLQDVKTTVVAAGNATLTDVERGFMASELRGRFEQLLGLANTRDGMGNHMFSGFQTATPAFVESASGATYLGDAGQLRLQVDANRQMAINATGQAVFQGGGVDVFSTLKSLISVLQTPVVDATTRAALDAGLGTANASLDTALDNVLTVRASVGARLQELDASDKLGEDRHIRYSEALSGMQDLDYTEALTRLTQQQVTLEAAQRSFVSVSGLSLFNYL